MKFIAIVLFLIALSGISLAADTTAGKLSQQCKQVDNNTANTDADLSDLMSCVGYLDGWLDAMIIGSDRFVIASHISIAQTAQVFILYMSKHPEKENALARELLLTAMMDANLVTISSEPNPKANK